jgi:SAM-dependent methyltransferase
MPAMDYSKIAELYDIYAQTDIDVPFFIEEAKGCRNALELTSGTGRLSIPLLQAGVNLSCLDSSPEMLAILRKKLQDQGISAPVYEMDVSSFSIPEQFDLIFIPFNAFAEITDPVLQIAALIAIRSHLTNAGRLICTLHNPAIRLKNVDSQIHLRGKYAMPDGGTLILSSMESYNPGAQLVKGAQYYEIYSQDGVMQSKLLVDLEFTLHTKDSFERLIDTQGFHIVSLYGDYSRSEFVPDVSPFMIWVLR